MEQNFFQDFFLQNTKISSLKHVKEHSKFHSTIIKHLTNFLIIFWYNNFSNVWNILNARQILRIRFLVTFVENELELETRLFKTSSLLIQTPPLFESGTF